MSSNLAERIKERLNIVDIVGQYVKLTRAGINHKGCCPFHHEKTPSFFVSEQRQTFTCFGCGVKGDMIEFVQQFERLDFREALKVLFDKSGLPEDEWENSKQRDPKALEEDQIRKRVYTVMQTAVEVYSEELKHSDYKRALDYLHKRGLKDETITNWHIGFAPDLWQFIEARVSNTYQERTISQDLVAAGLLKVRDNAQETHRISGNTYDFFRGRITFPIFDVAGKPVAISARIVDQGEPKYLNSPDTPIFNKSQVLYGLHKAKDGMRKWKFALLVEGQLDLLLCHQEGFDQTVATSGTALTDDHLRLLKRYTNNLMLVYDADQAGMKATVKAWSLALKHGLEVKVALLPKNEDPASLLLENKGMFVHALKHAMHVIEYVLSKSDITSRSGKKDTMEKLIPLVASLDNSVDKEHFTKRIADVFDMSLDSIYTEIQRFKGAEHGNISTRGTFSIESVMATGGVQLLDGQDKLAGIRQSLAELKALLYIYTQQLNSSQNQSDGAMRPDIYEKIKTKIEEFKTEILGKTQAEYYPAFNADVESFIQELVTTKFAVDERLVYNIENIHAGKEVDAVFYEKEINIAYRNLMQKIYTLVFDEVKSALKKAEVAKDKQLIDMCSGHIYQLSIYKTKLN